MVTLRILKESDVQYFLRWWRDAELIDSTSGNHDTITDTQAQGYFDSFQHSAEQIHRMIDVSGVTVGHISLIPHSAGEYELQTIIGEPEYQNKGYGTQAIKAMLELAKGLSIKTVILFVRPENARAIHTYEKSGFKQAGNIIKTANSNQPELIKMELDL